MLYHLEDIEKIRDIEKSVSACGSRVFDISHWDSGAEYNKLLLTHLEMNAINMPFKYIYNYEIPQEIHNSVEEIFLHENIGNIHSVFFPSSTLAIVNLANFFQKKNIKNICILQPSYFTVEPCLNAFGLNVECISLTIDDEEFKIPTDKIFAKKYDAVWLTSPVFCTSTYFPPSEKIKLKSILDRNIFLICDESLSIHTYTLRNILPNRKNLITIHSPHKVISTNAIKFSCILCHSSYEEFFDQWIDLFCGGLPLSSIVAIRHFLSPNYSKCLGLHIGYTNSIKQHIIKLLHKYNSQITYSHTIGQYMTIFCPMVSFEESKEIDFIKELIINTHVSLLPGYLEGFYEELGFCFRINLTLDKTSLISSVQKVLNYLEYTYP